METSSRIVLSGGEDTISKGGVYRARNGGGGERGVGSKRHPRPDPQRRCVELVEGEGAEGWIERGRLE